ncbi:MAG: hypothetical protein NTX48_05680 [Planctomycetales bacterium]|nr:hypothetical protein [Planctomycetales bacterium]
MSSRNQLAPIALFVYRRLQHARATVESLLQNPESQDSDLFIFCDAAKSADVGDAVAEVREFVQGISGFRSITIIERKENFGLSRNIIGGVTDVLSKAGRVIVVEDDLVSSPFFLRYMNDGLDVYADDSPVASIHGYVYPVDRPLPETFFLRGADCWGWATWTRAWQCFCADGQKLLAELERQRLLGEFDMEGAFAFAQMLRDQTAGKNDSWAIRWHASTFLAGMYTLYPGKSLVQNIGNDSSGTHCHSTNAFESALSNDRVRVQKQEVVENDDGKEAFRRFYLKQSEIASSSHGSSVKIHRLITRYCWRMLQKCWQQWIK